MKGHLRFLRAAHSEAVRNARKAGWSPATQSWYLGQAVGLRRSAIALIALIRRAEEAA